MRLRLVCGNCGREEAFEAATAAECFEAASRDNWDTADRFGYTACWECPGVAVYLPLYYAQLARMEAEPTKREALLAQAAEESVREYPKFPRA